MTKNSIIDPQEVKHKYTFEEKQSKKMKIQPKLVEYQGERTPTKVERSKRETGYSVKIKPNKLPPPKVKERLKEKP